MSKLSPKLSSEFKRVFLKHSVRRIGQPSQPNEGKGKFFKFVKLLLVSESYLQISRQPSVYYLAFLFDDPKANEPKLSFSYSLNITPYNTLFNVESRELHNFLSVLQPFEIFAIFNSSIRRSLLKRLDQYLSNGRLVFASLFDSHVHFRIALKYSQKIDRIVCHSSFLIDNQMPCLNLSFCRIDLIESFDQLADVLRHKIKRLDFSVSSRSNFLTELNPESAQALIDRISIRNHAVEYVTLRSFELTNDNIRLMLHVLKTLCPNVNLINISSKFFYDGEKFDNVNPLVALAGKYYHELKELFMIGCSFVRNCSVEFLSTGISIDDEQYIETWSTQTDFTDWKCTKQEVTGATGQTSKVIESFAHEYGNIGSMRLEIDIHMDYCDLDSERSSIASGDSKISDVQTDNEQQELSEKTPEDETTESVLHGTKLLNDDD